MAVGLNQLRRVVALLVLMWAVGFLICGYKSWESPVEEYAAATAGFETPFSSSTTKRKNGVQHNAEQGDPDLHKSHIAILPLLPLVKKNISNHKIVRKQWNLHNAEQEDPHNSHISILPLLPWEVETISNHKIKESSAPRNIPKTCALGSISKGGGTFPSANCGGGKSTYDRVQQRVREWLPEDGVCDTCRILDILAEKNLTLSFWGDSIHHQVFDGFICELSRRNYTIVNKEIWKHPPGGMFILASIVTVTVTSPNWQQQLQENKHATIKFFFQYKPRLTVEKIYNESIIPILEGGTDILFFNFGLHWRRIEDSAAYKVNMLTTMTALKQHAVGSGKISLVAFRETSAQHFDTPLGEFNGTAPYNCTPLNTTNPLFGWRDRAILDAANKSGFTPVVVDPSGKTPLPPLRLPLHHSDDNKDGEIPFFVLPFNEFTSQFHDLHPHECSHYCSTPHIWNPLWRSLRLTMDRRYNTNNIPTATAGHPDDSKRWTVG
jgi:hypothetical protein